MKQIACLLTFACLLFAQRVMAEPSLEGTPRIIESGNHAENLNISKDEIVVVQFRDNDRFSIAGDLVNSGFLYAINSGNAGTATFFANNIINTGTISTTIPASLASLFPLSSALNLQLVASGSIANSGTISSSNNLLMAAGGSISNTGTSAAAAAASVLAQNNIALISSLGVISNTGIIASNAGNINISTVMTDQVRNFALASVLDSLSNSSANQLTIWNVNGTVQASSGNIIVGDFLSDARTNILIEGGQLLSQELNFNSLLGTIDVSAHEISGIVNADADAAFIGTATGNLTLGNICLKGDPTYYNQIGSISLNGTLTANDYINIFASGSIFGSITSIDAPSVIMEAGVNIVAPDVAGRWVLVDDVPVFVPDVPRDPFPLGGGTFRTNQGTWTNGLSGREGSIILTGDGLSIDAGYIALRSNNGDISLPEMASLKSGTSIEIISDGSISIGANSTLDAKLPVSFFGMNLSAREDISIGQGSLLKGPNINIGAAGDIFLEGSLESGTGVILTSGSGSYTFGSSASIKGAGGIYFDFPNLDLVSTIKNAGTIHSKIIGGGTQKYTIENTGTMAGGMSFARPIDLINTGQFEGPISTGDLKISNTSLGDMKSLNIESTGNIEITTTKPMEINSITGSGKLDIDSNNTIKFMTPFLYAAGAITVTGEGEFVVDDSFDHLQLMSDTGIEFKSGTVTSKAITLWGPYIKVGETVNIDSDTQTYFTNHFSSTGFHDMGSRTTIESYANSPLIVEGTGLNLTFSIGDDINIKSHGDLTFKGNISLDRDGPILLKFAYAKAEGNIINNANLVYDLPLYLETNNVFRNTNQLRAFGNRGVASLELGVRENPSAQNELEIQGLNSMNTVVHLISQNTVTVEDDHFSAEAIRITLRDGSAVELPETLSALSNIVVSNQTGELNFLNNTNLSVSAGHGLFITSSKGISIGTNSRIQNSTGVVSIAPLFWDDATANIGANSLIKGTSVDIGADAGLTIGNNVTLTSTGAVSSVVFGQPTPGVGLFSSENIKIGEWVKIDARDSLKIDAYGTVEIGDNSDFELTSPNRSIVLGTVFIASRNAQVSVGDNVAIDSSAGLILAGQELSIGEYVRLDATGIEAKDQFWLQAAGGELKVGNHARLASNSDMTIEAALGFETGRDVSILGDSNLSISSAKTVSIGEGNQLGATGFTGSSPGVLEIKAGESIELGALSELSSESSLGLFAGKTISSDLGVRLTSSGGISLGSVNDIDLGTRSQLRAFGQNATDKDIVFLSLDGLVKLSDESEMESRADIGIISTKGVTLSEEMRILARRNIVFQSEGAIEFGSDLSMRTELGGMQFAGKSLRFLDRNSITSASSLELESFSGDIGLGSASKIQSNGSITMTSAGLLSISSGTEIKSTSGNFQGLASQIETAEDTKIEAAGNLSLSSSSNFQAENRLTLSSGLATKISSVGNINIGNNLTLRTGAGSNTTFNSKSGTINLQGGQNNSSGPITLAYGGDLIVIHGLEAFEPETNPFPLIGGFIPRLINASLLEFRTPFSFTNAPPPPGPDFLPTPLNPNLNNLNNLPFFAGTVPGASGGIPGSSAPAAQTDLEPIKINPNPGSGTQSGSAGGSGVANQAGIDAVFQPGPIKRPVQFPNSNDNQNVASNTQSGGGPGDGDGLDHTRNSAPDTRFNSNNNNSNNSGYNDDYDNGSNNRGDGSEASDLGNSNSQSPNTPEPSLWERVKASFNGTKDEIMAKLGSATSIIPSLQGIGGGSGGPKYDIGLPRIPNIFGGGNGATTEQSQQCPPPQKYNEEKKECEPPQPSPSPSPSPSPKPSPSPEPGGGLFDRMNDMMKGNYNKSSSGVPIYASGYLRPVAFQTIVPDFVSDVYAPNEDSLLLSPSGALFIPKGAVVLVLMNKQKLTVLTLHDNPKDAVRFAYSNKLVHVPLGTLAASSIQEQSFGECILSKDIGNR
ncbi:MAG: hypothetical protein K2X77_27575, partial [Candidatus Obscuribacterales bacterium]|nr:hypothetical protein [Candidatus Obscuribacterales bacterium]